MDFHLGIEDMEPNSWIAWVFELPGCYARATTREEAIDRAPEAIAELLERLEQSGYPLLETHPSINTNVVEEFRSFPSSPDYIVNAFFDNDRIPLTDVDIKYAQHLLSLNRNDLLAVVANLPAETVDREITGEVQKNINGILRHIGTAEWWYWDRIGLAFPREERPKEVFELLNKIREFTLQHLPELVGSGQTTNRSGEDWSARKLLRRAIWHERAHTVQILRYLKSMKTN